MTTLAIELKPVEGEVHLNCPDCQSPRLTVTASSRSVPGGGYWLDDGDSVPDLEGVLQAKGYEQQPWNIQASKGRISNYDYELAVGTCPHCDSEYYVLSAKLIDDAVSVDEEFVQRYFFDNLPVAEPTNWIAKHAGKNLQWHVQRHETPVGVAAAHTFGPFSLRGATLKGIHGVAGCAGGPEGRKHWEWSRDFLADIWPDLKALALAINSSARVSGQA
ncbi:hypothetical protein ACKU3Z_030080 [Pseudomonas aeruginosa]|nr:hypothetical protein [Pseudomonas aeruginosa]